MVEEFSVETIVAHIFKLFIVCRLATNIECSILINFIGLSARDLYVFVLIF